MTQSALISMDFTNAQTGEPLNVVTSVSATAIVCRIEDKVYVVHSPKLTPYAARHLAQQINSVLKE